MQEVQENTVFVKSIGYLDFKCQFTRCRNERCFIYRRTQQSLLLCPNIPNVCIDHLDTQYNHRNMKMCTVCVHKASVLIRSRREMKQPGKIDGISIALDILFISA